jgi:hypothetical protein
MISTLYTALSNEVPSEQQPPNCYLIISQTTNEHMKPASEAKKRKLSNDPKCIKSRAYHEALKKAICEGKDEEAAKLEARVAYKAMGEFLRPSRSMPAV